MKKGLEELKKLEHEVVTAKVHILQTTLDDIVNKRFEKLHPVKAKGFIKILEREFDLDLSDWMSEFDAYHNVKEPELPTIDKLHAEVAKTESKPFSKLLLFILVALGLAGGAYLVYLQKSSAVADTGKGGAIQNEINETNSTISFNIAFDENKTEHNVTAEANTTIPKVDINSSSTQVIAPNSFYVEPSRRVWIGIRYLDADNNRWFETVSEGKFDFNPARDQLISFGHSQVRLVVGATKIEAKEGGKVRYYYKNGKLQEVSEAEYNKIAGKEPAKKENNQTKNNNNL